MPEPITIEALEAIGFSIQRDRDGDRVVVFASMRINEYLGLSFYDGKLHLDNGGDPVYAFPDDMIHARRAMQLFDLPEPDREPAQPGPIEQPAVVAPIIPTEPRGVGRPKKTPGDLKAVDLRIPVTEAQHAAVKAAAGDMGIAEWSRRILLSAAQ